MGIEPTSSAWKAEVIPIYDTRIRSILERLKSDVKPAKFLPGYLLLSSQGVSVKEFRELVPMCNTCHEDCAYMLAPAFPEYEPN